MDLDTQVIQVNEYDLAADSASYVAAITQLAARTEQEGDPGVLEYRFFVDRARGTAGATIVYADADAWKRHHELAYQWEEMSALQSTVTLNRLTILGPLGAAVEGWLTGAGISFVHYPDSAAAFVR